MVSGRFGASGGGADSAAADSPPVVYLHIGAPKTGTTYLQKVLWRNRDQLQADGLLYPGRSFADHVHAAFDLRQTGFHGYQHPDVPGTWARIVEEIRLWGGPALISQELFSPADRDQVDRAMSALSFAEVHLIYTARDLVRQIPAAWQEDVKNRHVLGFNDFIHSLHEPDGPGRHLGRAFWRMQDAVEVLERWGTNVPPERIHVVTVPPSWAPPGTLWERFAGLLGLDPSRYDAAATGANLSLGAAEATMLRHLNLRVGNNTSWPIYSQYVKHYLAEEILAGRSDLVKIVLPAEEHPWVVARSKELVAGIQTGGYDVVGDLDDLIPSPSPVSTPSSVDDPPAELQLEAALDSMAGLLRRIDRIRARERQLREELDDMQARRRQPVKTIVRDLSRKYRVVMRAREKWWHAVERLQRVSAWGRRRRETVSSPHHEA